MARYTHKREYYIPKGATKIEAKDSTAVAYIKTGTGNGEHVDVVAFRGRQQKPCGNYRFRKGIEAAQVWVERFLRDVAADEQRKANEQQRRVERAAAMRERVKPGDIFYTSWGYDQTNIGFYKIIKKMGAMIEYAAIGKEIMPDGQAADLVMPDPDLVGERTYRAKLTEYGFRVASYAFAYPWDGAPKHQTAMGYGH